MRSYIISCQVRWPILQHRAHCITHHTTQKLLPSETAETAFQSHIQTASLEPILYDTILQGGSYALNQRPLFDTMFPRGEKKKNVPIAMGTIGKKKNDK